MGSINTQNINTTEATLVPDVHPVRRDMTFEFNKETITSWHQEGVMTSNFFNALSVFFPVGEQFFIDSVRHYRELGVIDDDEQLLKDVRHFIGQEAMHGREHRDYNAALDEAGMGALKMDGQVANLLKAVKKILPQSRQLAATCALEHMTAALADSLLQRPDALEKSNPELAAAWRWHALEETEHKAVAFDVFQKAVGDDTDTRAYLNRSSAMVTAMVIFWPMALTYWAQMNYRSGHLFDLKGWGKSIKFLMGPKKGVMTPAAKDLFTYFKRGFHPWDHDNSAYLSELAEMEKKYTRAKK